MYIGKFFSILLFLSSGAFAQKEGPISHALHETLPNLSEWSYRLTESLFRKASPEEKEMLKIERRLMSNRFYPNIESDLKRWQELRPKAEAARNVQANDLSRRNHICPPSTDRDLHNLIGGKCPSESGHDQPSLREHLEKEMEIRAMDLTVSSAVEELTCELNYAEHSFGRESPARQEFDQNLKGLISDVNKRGNKTSVPIAFSNAMANTVFPQSDPTVPNVLSDSILAVVDLMQIQKRLDEIEAELTKKNATPGYTNARVGILPSDQNSVNQLNKEKQTLSTAAKAVYNTLWNIQNEDVRKVVDKYINNRRLQNLTPHSEGEQTMLAQLKEDIFVATSKGLSEKFKELQGQIDRRLAKGDYSDSLKREVVDQGRHKELADRLSSTEQNLIKDRILTPEVRGQPGLVAAGLYEADCRLQMRFGRGRDDLLFYTDMALMAANGFYSPFIVLVAARAYWKCSGSPWTIKDRSQGYCDRYYSSPNYIATDRKNEAVWNQCSISEMAMVLGGPMLKMPGVIWRSSIAKGLLKIPLR